MHMIMFVLDDPDRLDAVLDAWEAVGVSGVTIIESSGIQRRRIARGRLPVRFAFEQISPRAESGNYTLFVLVYGEATVRKCLAAAESVVGDLDEPNTGVLAAWPLTIVKGVPRGAGGDEAS